MSEMTATRTRTLAGGATLLVLGAGWSVAGFFLWDSSTVPDDLRLPDLQPATYFPDQLLDRAERFDRFLRWNWVLSTVTVLVTLAVYAVRGDRFTRESAAGRIGTGMLLGMLGFAIVWLVEIPFSVASLWWFRRYGLAEEGYLEFIFGDWLLLGGQFLFLCLALVIVMGLAGVMGQHWWILGGPSFVGILALFLFVYPYLSNLDRPKDRQLVAQARAIAKKQGIDDVPLRIEDLPDDTKFVNAWAAGLGPSRRVVLWDTFLDGRFSRNEIGVVIAHEYGHHSRTHLPKGIAWYALFAIPGAFLIERLTRRRGGMRNPAAVPLSLFVLVALQLVAAPVDNLISRRMEAEADWAALQTTRRPVAARGLFQGFTRTSLSDPDPPTWSYLVRATHPTILQRIAMVEAWKRRQAGR
jgi:STE24 endopeptidase